MPESSHPAPGPSLPSAAAVQRDLREVVKLGLRSIADAPLPNLRALEVVRTEAVSSDNLHLGFAAEAVLARTVELLGRGYLAGVVRALFGLDSETYGKQAKERRLIAARRAESSFATFNRHDEDRFVRAVAVEVLRQEVTFRRQAERAAWANRPLTDEEKTLGWAERFGYYNRLRAVVTRLRHDIIALVVGLTTDTDAASRNAYLNSSLWWYARFLAELDRFQRSALGGRWVFPEPESEVAAASSTYQLLWRSPFNEQGHSLLRLTLGAVAAGELPPFAHRLATSPDGGELLGMWEQWAGECPGDFELADDACDLHALVDQADRLAEIVEQQWGNVAERLRELPEV